MSKSFKHTVTLRTDMLFSCFVCERYVGDQMVDIKLIQVLFPMHSDSIQFQSVSEIESDGNLT